MKKQQNQLLSDEFVSLFLLVLEPFQVELND